MWNERSMTRGNTVIVETTINGDQLVHKVHPVAYMQIGEVFSDEGSHPAYGVVADRNRSEAFTSWPCEDTRESIAARKLANEIDLREWARQEAMILERWRALPNELQTIVGDFWHFRIVMAREESLFGRSWINIVRDLLDVLVPQPVHA